MKKKRVNFHVQLFYQHYKLKLTIIKLNMKKIFTYSISLSSETISNLTSNLLHHFGVKFSSTQLYNLYCVIPKITPNFYSFCIFQHCSCICSICISLTLLLLYLIYILAINNLYNTRLLLNFMWIGWSRIGNWCNLHYFRVEFIK